MPADARLSSGDACIDYSFVTGESEPVSCSPGQHLYAGGRQTGGAIEVETVKPVAQSYLASLWDSEAFRKPRENDLNSLTNQYSRRFTKLIVIVAVSAAGYWLFRDATKSLKVFTSVLIVACPCAFALAAPLAYGTVQRILARRNIYLKNPLVIERMARVDTIVLDKTGTLTTADARGIEFIAPLTLTGAEKTLIASLARHSAHPYSVRIAKNLAENFITGESTVQGFKETPGGGIEGVVEGRQVLMGSRAWLETQHGIVVTEPRFASAHNSVSVVSGSGVLVALDGKYRGAFALENSLRPEVKRLIGQLGGRFELALLSGDNPREAAKFRDIFG